MPVIFRDKDKLDSMRKRIPKDVYQTPMQLAVATCSFLANHFNWRIIGPDHILDAGAGRGVWGIAARGQWPKSFITGVELRRLPPASSYSTWLKGEDFLKMFSPSRPKFNLVIGNPPFSLAEPFVWKGLELGRFVCYLLPSHFVHGQKRARGLFTERPPMAVVHLAQRPNFTGPKGESLGTANTDTYDLMIWNSSLGKHAVPQTCWLDWKTE